MCAQSLKIEIEKNKITNIKVSNFLCLFLLIVFPRFVLFLHTLSLVKEWND